MPSTPRVPHPSPSQKTSRAVDHYFRVLDTVRPTAPAPEISIAAETARERKLKNDNAEQDIVLKRQTLNRLFWFLGVETALIFAVAICQALRWPHRFHLDEASFRVLTTATILQVAAMLSAAVRYLFPKGRG